MKLNQVNSMKSQRTAGRRRLDPDPCQTRRRVSEVLDDVVSHSTIAKIVGAVLSNCGQIRAIWATGVVHAVIGRA